MILISFSFVRVEGVCHADDVWMEAMTALNVVLLVIWIGTGLILEFDPGVPGERHGRMGVVALLSPPGAGFAGLLFAGFFFGAATRQAGFVFGFLAFTGLLLWQCANNFRKR